MKDQNKSLRSLIPKTWMDRDAIMEIMIVACFKEWVEKEEGLWPHLELMLEAKKNRNNAEYVKTRWQTKELLDNYLYALPQYKKFAKIYHWLSNTDWRNVLPHSKEEKIFNQYVLCIVKYRGYLWT